MVGQTEEQARWAGTDEKIGPSRGCAAPVSLFQVFLPNDCSLLQGLLHQPAPTGSDSRQAATCYSGLWIESELHPGWMPIPVATNVTCKAAPCAPACVDHHGLY